MFVHQNKYRRNAAYNRLLEEDLLCHNNAYYNDANAQVFDGINNTPVDLATWKAISSRADFESGSAWGHQPSATAHVEEREPLAPQPSQSSVEMVAAGTWRFQAEHQPFTASRPVRMRINQYPGADTVHILEGEQVENYGDWIEYHINIPQSGDYYVIVSHPMGSGGFAYLGYAHLLIVGKPASNYFDQHALRPSSMRVTHALPQKLRGLRCLSTPGCSWRG